MSAATEAPGWDCHAHVFGPYDRYPLAEGRSYTPPEAPLPAYLAHLARLGLGRGVLVHPSAYGGDFSLLLDVLAQQPQLRGVVGPLPGSTPDMASLRSRGVRALRFSHRSAGNYAGSATVDDLVRLAPAMADAGLHAEMWSDCQALLAARDAITALPVPLVIDHMGGFDLRRGVDDPGFRFLLERVAAGRVWVKLCAYRTLLGHELQAGRPFHQALLQAGPGQLVWGSDWPYLRVDPAPEGVQLLELLREWTPDAAMQRRILVENPARLYG